MKKEAKIYTYSVVRSPSEEFIDKAPYVVASVDDGHEIFFTRIEGYKEGMDIKIGMTVMYDKEENGRPIYKF